MVVAAGVHAAGYVQLDRTQVVKVIEVVEFPLNRLGDRNRLGIRQRAEVAAGAADDVGQGTYVCRGEAGAAQLVPQLKKLIGRHVRQHHVLIVGGAHFAERIAVGQVGDGFELSVREITGGDADEFEGEGDCAVARHLVRLHIVAEPVAEFPVLCPQAVDTRHYVRIVE